MCKSFYRGDVLFKNINIITAIFFCAFFVTNSVNAQLEFLVDGYEEKYIQDDEGPGVEISSGEEESHNDQYIYESPTVKALSYMFWSLGLYKTSDNNAVDEFLRINECELYKRFSSDELEWGELRDAAKIFIEENKSEFPTRFTFILPLKLADYNIRRQAFELQDDYKIRASRRFELYAKDFDVKPCVREFGVEQSYPRILNMEFSRPFNLTHVPMTEDVANNYIKKTNDLYHKIYEERLRSKDIMYRFRDAFLVMKVKIFAHGKNMGIDRRGRQIIQAMGMLESYSIFADKELAQLFYKQSYVANKKKGKLDMRLKEQYDILRERSKAGGILNQ